MACLTEDDLLGFARGTLAPDDRRQAERHLDACLECRLTVGEVATLVTLRPAVSGEDAEETLPGAALTPGTQVGRYLITRLVGAGAGGLVHEAWDPQLGRRVGLKQLRVSAGSEPDATALRHLLREAQAMARLSHPNVVAVHDAGVHAGTVYIVLEWVEGQTLTNWLRAEPRPWREIVRRFVEVGRGLEAAHDKGLVHRDFKPDNALVDAEGRARLCDFGLARALSGATEPADAPIAGTPAFMAPEQSAGAAPDARVDQYAFAVALSWALTGRPPEGVSVPDAMAPCGDVSDRSRIPGRLLRVIARGSARRPDDRHPSMTALLHAIAAEAAPRRRWPWIAAGVAGATAMTAGAVALRPQPAAERLGTIACEDGKFFEGGHCFTYDPVPRPYAEAARLCAALGGQLATCLSDGECRAIERVVPSSSSAWIGLRRERPGASLVWDTDEPVLPPIAARIGGSEAGCGLLDAGGEVGRRWSLSACDEPRPHLCETAPWLTLPDGHAYRVFAQRLPQPQASAGCKALGPSAHLATITSPSEQAAIERMLAVDITTYPVLWIGSVRRGPTRALTWVTDEPFAWTNFARRQPDDYDGRQDCVAIDMKTKGWHDRYCESRYESICERE